MMTDYLVKLGELTLKGRNRKSFEFVLRKNLSALLKGSGAQIFTQNGRFYVRCPIGKEEIVEDSLARLIGIAGWAKTRSVEKTTEDVIAACVDEGKFLWEKGRLLPGNQQWRDSLFFLSI